MVPFYTISDIPLYCIFAKIEVVKTVHRMPMYMVLSRLHLVCTDGFALSNNTCMQASKKWRKLIIPSGKHSI